MTTTTMPPADPGDEYPDDPHDQPTAVDDAAPAEALPADTAPADRDEDRPDEDRADDEDEAPVRVDLPVRRGEDRVTVADRARAHREGRSLDRRRAIVPPWVLDRSERTDVARWARDHTWHTARYHAIRTPKYAGRLLIRSPRGALRVVRKAGGWVFDADARPLRVEAVRINDFDRYIHLDRLRRDKLRWRLLLALVVLAVIVAAGALVAAGGTLLHLVVAAAVVVVLGLLGAPDDVPLLDTAVVRPKAQRLTSVIVVRALAALGIAQVNAAVSKGVGISFVAPITRDGPGWRAEIDLPYGVTVPDVMERRDRLASGLRRPLGCVWPEPAHHEHAGRLVLWVGDQDMSQAKPIAGPLADAKRVDLFGPVPFGTDQRGRNVSVALMYSNVLIGAMPGAGKTFSLRVLALAAALDPTAQVRCFELKGSGDLSALERVAHHYGSGADDGTVAACVESLRQVYGELDSRARTIAGLPRAECPENKTTRDLARVRSRGLYPLVFIIDECQELFSHPRYGKEAAELVVAIIKRGRALGILLLLATQRPDKDSLPTGVSSNVGIRFALKVMGQVENDMILGTSMYRNGVRATTFTKHDKGIGYLVGADDEPQITRSYYLDGPASEAIAERARVLRERAGTLTGYAAGQADDDQDEDATVRLLDDLVVVTAPGPDAEADTDGVWSETVCERLAELRPDAYTGWKPAQLATAVKPYGIATRQVWGTDPNGVGRNRRGLTRADVLAALDRRDEVHDTPPGDTSGGKGGGRGHR